MDDVKILVPLDGSKLAEHALAYVPALMPLGLSEVEIVSVVEPETVPVRRGLEDEERQLNLLAAYHKQLAEELGAQTTLHVETKARSGPAAQAIIQEAETFQPDYLVISTHGASGISRWRFGSVADKVIRGAGCSTLVIGPKAAEREEWLSARLMPVFKSILVPLDGSGLAEQALTVARRFVDAFGAQVHLVSAVSSGALGGNAAWVGVSGHVEADLMQVARDYLERVSVQTPDLGDLHVAVRFGSPAQALSDYIAAESIDLVIMTSHGRGDLSRTALGSTTDRLLGGDAPVLIVRGQDQP